LGTISRFRPKPSRIRNSLSSPIGRPFSSLDTTSFETAQQIGGVVDRHRVFGAIVAHDRADCGDVSNERIRVGIRATQRGRAAIA
jgi:hypothetical protein